MFLERFGFFKRMIPFPSESLVMRTIEIFNSIPVLVIILAFAAIAKPSLMNVVLIIGITFWTDIARVVRAEIMRLRSTEFIIAAEALGLTPAKIILRHALPNCMIPVLVYLSFGTASAIMVESGLSFLGIGLPPETVSWGTLLAEGKENFSAWWLVVFPGAMIFLTVWSLNSLADRLAFNT
jgi:peptide/nickel transport system permease protein